MEVEAVMPMEGIVAEPGIGSADVLASRGPANYFAPPPLPVLLRIPRMEEKSEEPRAISTPHPRYRWSVGLGATVLMLIISLPWVVRWRPGPSAETVTGRPIITVEENVQPLSPLASDAKAAATLAFEPGEDSATGRSNDIATADSERVEFWVAPTAAGGTP